MALPPNTNNTAQIYSSAQSYLDAYNAKVALLDPDTGNPAEAAELEFEDTAATEEYLTIVDLQTAQTNAQALLNSVQAKSDSYDAIMAQAAVAIIDYFTLYPDSIGIYFPATDQNISYDGSDVVVEPGIPEQFNPLDISDCILWLDGAQGVTTSGANVDQWDDQSSSGYIFTAGGGARPTFNGTDNSINFASASFQGLVSGTIGFGTTEDLTVFIVFNDMGGFTKEVLFEGSVQYDANNSFTILLNDGTDSTVTAANFGDVGYDVDVMAHTKNVITYTMSEFIRSRTPETQVYVDADNTGSSHPNTADNTNNFSDNVLYIGNRALSDRFFNGKIFEALIYSRELTSGEKTQLNQYFTDKYL